MSIEFEQKESYAINDLIEIVKLLRSDNGCPWDKVQTHESIRNNFIEETYEVCEAIDLNDQALLLEELGDVLLQVVFHALMEEEAGHFVFDDVCDGICKKLILRHPHIFSNVRVENTDQVLDNWESIKQKSKGQTNQSQTLESVPKTFPALMRAQKVQKRAAKSGLGYPDVTWAMGDLGSEVDELQCALKENNAEHLFEELGDVLFSAVNVARHIKVDAEEALNASTEKFIKRFALVEKMALEQGINMDSADMQTLDALWKKAKVMVQQNLDTNQSHV